MLLAQVHTPEAVEILRRFVSGKEGWSRCGCWPVRHWCAWH